MSTLFWLMRELYGRSNLGEGALKVEGSDLARMPVLPPGDWSKGVKNEAKTLLCREQLPLREEMRQPDRLAIDDVVGDVLRLTKGEREAVRSAVICLVEARIEKANSLRR